MRFRFLLFTFYVLIILSLFQDLGEIIDASTPAAIEATMRNGADNF